jgi:hypothetical protein
LFDDEDDGDGKMSAGELNKVRVHGHGRRSFNIRHTDVRPTLRLCVHACASLRKRPSVCVRARAREHATQVYDRMIKHLIGEMTFALMTFLFIIFVVIMPLCTHYHFLRPTADPPWTPVEAFYWSIITFSTIGLGDYVPMTGTPASLWGDFLNGSQVRYIRFSSAR